VIAGGNAQPHRGIGSREFAQPRGVAGSRPAHPGLQHSTDPIALEQEREARDMIFVGVRQDDRVDPPIPWRDLTIQRDQEAIRVGPAVDQQPAAA
jgi:hypothetical protein